MKRRAVIGLLLVGALLVFAATGGPAGAVPFSSSTPTLVTGPSPLPPGCEGASQFGLNYENAEVEPYVAVSPPDSTHLIGVWQQDRWSSGSAHGLLTAVSSDSGATWTEITNPPHFSICTGGNAANGGDFFKASDPWVTIGPTGVAYEMSLSSSRTPTNVIISSAMLVSGSTDGGTTWSEPITLKRDNNSTVFNDKNAITADPNDPSLVYAVWDRLVFPNEQAAAAAGEHAVGFRGPTWFARTTDGGNTWEPARMIFDPGQNNQTIGNQIVVLPDGTLVDVFDLINSTKNHQVRGLNVAVIRSTDHGLTWSKPIIVDKLLTVGVKDPTTGEPVRTGDIIPEIAVDRTSGALYAVWQDSRFSGGLRDGIAFSKSSDGGLTWSAPVQINQVPTTPAFTAQVRVADDGTIGVTYYDFRNDTSDPNVLQTDYFLVHSHDGGATWAETHIAGSFDMRTAPVSRGFFTGDYEGLTNVVNSFVSFFVQTNSGNTSNRTDVFAATVGP